MNKTIYKGSKAKIALMGLLIIALFGACIPLYYLLEWLSSEYTGFLITIAWFLISFIPVLVGLGLIVTIVSLLIGKYELTLNETGVELQTNFGKKKTIDWNDVTAIDLKEKFFNKTIVLLLKDNQAYISELSPLMQRGIPALMSRFGSPCTIEVGLANAKAKDILAEMRSYLEKYQAKEEI